MEALKNTSGQEAEKLKKKYQQLLLSNVNRKLLITSISHLT